MALRGPGHLLLLTRAAMLVSELAPIQKGTTIFYCAHAILLNPAPVARRMGGQG